MIRRKTSFGLCGLLLLASFPSVAKAAVIVYSDKAAFLADTGALPATTIPTDSQGLKPDPYTSGSLTFRNGTFFVFDWTTRLPGNDLALGGLKDSFDVTSGLISSFGFDFVEPQFDPNVNDPFLESTFAVTLLNGAMPVGSFTFERPNDSAEFVGVWTGPGEAFNRVEIREIVGEAENEFFGQFYTGTIAAAAVPEPSSMIAWGGFTMLGLLVSRRRQRRRVK